ncbi:MAG: hypothetical protein KDH20_21390 [Rhodocyclaceae bacterium]|nr:hypothetical protein [Rhodocyclaceae bacterium]
MAGLHAACLPGLLLVDLPLALRCTAVAVLGASAWRARAQWRAGVGWHFLPGPPPELDDGQVRRAIVDATVTGPAVWLTWSDDDGRRGRMMLLEDAFDSADHWRRVRLVLRHGLPRDESAA